MTIKWEARVGNVKVAEGATAVEAKRNAEAQGYREDDILLVQHATEGLLST